MKVLSRALVEHYTQIEKGNRMLLERLTRIMGRRGSSSGCSKSCFSHRYKSLNRSYRKREISKIMDENKALLRRLQTKKPNYNTAQWNREYKSRAKLLNNICEYPYQFAAQSKSIRGKSPNFDVPKGACSGLCSSKKGTRCMLD